jgi:hypothetical protein
MNLPYTLNMEEPFMAFKAYYYKIYILSSKLYSVRSDYTNVWPGLAQYWWQSNFTNVWPGPILVAVKLHKWPDKKLVEKGKPLLPSFMQINKIEAS